MENKIVAKEKNEYIESVGRRKEATARVRIYPGSRSSFVINGEKDLDSYFSTAITKKIASQPLNEIKLPTKFKVSIKVKGGGENAQAEAIRHGLSRGLEKYDSNNRGELKKLGFLTRDPRVKERRKFGLKKARKAPQWSKR